ncbi:four helix bundle protein [Candidatus Beckwithbacteria bacterium]|nr:four helix bundle protein [Candidatus Beckwithbacteria bacterium]
MEERVKKINFYNISRGSLIEVDNQLQIAFDLGYLTKNTYNKLADQIISVYKLLNLLINSLKD